MANRHDEQLIGFTTLDNLFPIVDVVDNLTTPNTTRPLSANQGKVLKDIIDSLEDQIGGMGSGDTVTISNRSTTGERIVTININGTPYDIYAPQGGGGGGDSVQVNAYATEGNHVADIIVSGITYHLYSGPTGGGGASYTLPVASNEILGGVRLYSDTILSSTPETTPSSAELDSRTYAVQLNEANQMVVYVPWVASEGGGGESYTLPVATTSALGGVRLWSSTRNTVTPNSVSSITGRTYAVQLNSSNQMVVNVPWTSGSYTLPVATSSALGGVRIGYTNSGLNRAILLDGNNRMYVTLPGKPYNGGIYQLTSSTNLNNLEEEGLYSFFNSSLPSGLPSDWPTSHGALEVFGAGACLVQRITALNGATWVRTLNGATAGNVYTDWTRLGASSSGGSTAWGDITGIPNGLVTNVVLPSTSGNAITNVTFSNGTLTFTKGTIEGGGGGLDQTTADNRYLRKDIDDSTSHTLTAAGFYEPSDINLKKSIKDIEDNKSLDIKYKSFKWKDTNKQSYGVIAQQAEKIIPEVVKTNKEGIKSVNYTVLHSMQIDALLKRIEELEAKIEKLCQ